TSLPPLRLSSFSLHSPAPPEIYTLSLHDALPISYAPTLTYDGIRIAPFPIKLPRRATAGGTTLTPLAFISSSVDRENFVATLSRSEEHTSELQSRSDLVCRLLLEKKKKKKNNRTT